MENEGDQQNKQPVNEPQIIQPSAPLPTTTPVNIPPSTTVNPQIDSSVKKLSDEQANALLEINSLQTKQAKNSSYKFLYFVIAVIVLVTGISLALEVNNNSGNKTANKSSATTSTKDPFSSGSINNEVKYCSNPINAQLTC